MIRQQLLFKKRTKIVCTIGPATSTENEIEKLIRAGMNIARMNLSHQDHQAHSERIEMIRKVSHRLGIEVGFLMDLPGPKYRTGKLRGGQAILRKDAVVSFTTREIQGDEKTVPVNFPSLPRDTKPGDMVLLDDGAMRCRVLDKTETEVKCRVIIGGVLTENRGLVVPRMKTSGPFLTEDLKKHILFCVRQMPEYAALSFVSSADDITSVRAFMQKNGANIPLISKIERASAVRDFNAILNASDGVMVARGDLGVDIPLGKVPQVQMDIIHKSNRKGKPVITATQMLESMINAERPTRAEVTDVANAIYEGSDAVMLSGETAIGKYPSQTVEMMSRIALETEKTLPYESMLDERSSWVEKDTDELISYNACHIAAALGAKAIVAFTQSGNTARRVSKYRPRAAVIAITPDAIVQGRLLLYWGVYPVRIPTPPPVVDEMFSTAVEVVKNLNLAKPGDSIVITGGTPVGTVGATNLLKVQKVS